MDLRDCPSGQSLFLSISPTQTLKTLPSKKIQAKLIVFYFLFLILQRTRMVVSGSAFGYRG